MCYSWGHRFFFWSTSMPHDTARSITNSRKNSEGLSEQSHLFLSHKPYILLLNKHCIHRCSDLSCTLLPAGVFRNSGTFDGYFWRGTLLQLAGRDFLFLPSVLFHFLIYLFSCLCLSGKLRAQFSPKGLIIYLHDCSKEAVDCRTPHLSWEPLFSVGMEAAITRSITAQDAKMLRKTLAWSCVKSWSLKLTQT